jgi:hypothetical protein
MLRRAHPLALRTILISALTLSLLTIPSVTPESSATNPDCSPTAVAPGGFGGGGGSSDIGGTGGANGGGPSTGQFSNASFQRINGGHN